MQVIKSREYSDIPDTILVSRWLVNSQSLQPSCSLSKKKESKLGPQWSSNGITDHKQFQAMGICVSNLYSFRWARSCLIEGLAWAQNRNRLVGLTLGIRPTIAQIISKFSLSPLLLFKGGGAGQVGPIYGRPSCKKLPNFN